MNASTKETERFFRLAKEHQKRKIDAAVALSFAILGAVRSERPPPFAERNRPIRVEASFDVMNLELDYTLDDGTRVESGFKV